jgi:hypothetical protein
MATIHDSTFNGTLGILRVPPALEYHALCLKFYQKAF